MLGALAIVAPGLPRLKEWAYPGIAFDSSGAAISYAAVGDSADKILTPLVLLAIAVASWRCVRTGASLPRVLRLRCVSRAITSGRLLRPLERLVSDPARAHGQATTVGRGRAAC